MNMMKTHLNFDVRCYTNTELFVSPKYHYAHRRSVQEIFLDNILRDLRYGEERTRQLNTSRMTWQDEYQNNHF